MDWRPEFSSQGWCRPYAVKLLADINPVANLGVLLFEKLEEFPYQENKEKWVWSTIKKTFWTSNSVPETNTGIHISLHCLCIFSSSSHAVGC